MREVLLRLMADHPSTSFNVIFNVPINAWPKDREVCSCLRSGDALVSLMESTEHRCSEGMWNVEAAAVYNEVVIDAETVFNAPIPIHWLFQASFIIREATDDGLLRIRYS